MQRKVFVVISFEGTDSTEKTDLLRERIGVPKQVSEDWFFKECDYFYDTYEMEEARVIVGKALEIPEAGVCCNDLGVFRRALHKVDDVGAHTKGDL